MILPFTSTLKGHCRVINWFNFNIASQRIGRPGAEGWGEGMRKWPGGRAVRIYTKFFS